MFWCILIVVAFVVGYFLRLLFEIPFQFLLPFSILLIGVTVSSFYYSLNENGEYSHSVSKVVESQQLVSMGDAKEISGHSVLGTGSVSTDMKFYSYIQDESGFITLFEFPKDVKFKVSSNGAYYEKILTTGIDNFWVLNLVSEKEYIVYIPEGSFVNDYCFDLH